MDRAGLSNTLKRLCKVLWEANVTNPITYVTQTSYLLFLKMLEEMDADQKQAQNGNHRGLFGKIKVNGSEVDFGKLRWSVLTSNPDNEAMLRTMRDTLPLLAQHPLLSVAARAVFENAAVVIPNVGRFIGRGETEAQKTELSSIQSAVVAMMVDRSLSALPAGEFVVTGNATNNMALFPHSVYRLKLPPRLLRLLFVFGTL